MEPLIRYCPECDYNTSQRIEPLESNGQEGMSIYICNQCGESIGYVEDEKFLSRTRHLWEKK